MTDIFSIALRSAAVYLFIIIAIRIFGKRELTQLSVIDLVFILLLSNAVQNAMVGENSSLVGGIVAATALFIINRFLETIFAKSRRLSHFLQGEPLMLIYQGSILDDHLRRAKISMDELEAAVREHGVRDLTNVDLAVLETDGNISVLSDHYQKQTTRKRHAHKAITKTA